MEPLGPFDKTEKSDIPCPRCGGELLKVTRPVNHQVYQCQADDCENEFGEAYLAGWSDHGEAVENKNRAGFEQFINSYNASKIDEYKAGLANFAPMLLHYYQAMITADFSEQQAMYLTKEYAATLIAMGMQKSRE